MDFLFFWRVKEERIRSTMAHVKLRCDKLAFMGGICGKPSPPPDSDLVGHWVSDERAEVKGRSTSAMYRVARGYRPAIVGCGGNGKEYMRLEIHPSGWINYLKAEKDSFVTLIDMPGEVNQ